MAIVSLLCRPADFLVSNFKLLINPTNAYLLQHNFNHKSVKYNNIPISSKCYSTSRTSCSVVVSAAGYGFSELELDSSNQQHDDNDELYSSHGLERDLMPNHVGIALDGNRRWLESRGRDLSYMPFFDKNLDFAEFCLKWGIRKGTSFMWGLGNLTKRGEHTYCDLVSAARLTFVQLQNGNGIFLGQFERFLEDNFEYFNRKEIKVLAMGETSLLSESQQTTIKKVEEGTKNNSKLVLSLPVCYTGNRDITNATRKICQKVREGIIEPTDINDNMIEQELAIPIPDLFIRTGGEARIGALLSWQVAHTELYFTETLAPDFGEDVFVDALRSFQNRNRKFGK